LHGQRGPLSHMVVYVNNNITGGKKNSDGQRVKSINSTNYCICNAIIVTESKFINPVIWKEQVVLVVGAASSRDHLISRLPATSSAESEAAPTGIFFKVTWTFRISTKINYSV
jgi:hypothetical protein